jgi:hypothetical protein
MSSTVTVACNNPSGLVLELGLELDYATQRFVRTPAYKRVVLQGSQRKMIIATPKGSTPIATRGLEPGLTEVDRNFVEAWLKAHPRMSRYVWIVEKPADLKAQIADRPALPFEPMDPTKPFKFGADDMVTTANFNEP